MLRVALAAYLALWEPLSVASLAAATLPSLGFRGALADAELAWACLVAVVSMSAAWALWTKAPAATALARVAIIGIAVHDAQAIYWTRLPSAVAPGSRGALTAAVVAVNGLAWLAVARLGAGH